MAKTLFGALVVDMRNKLGGHVLSKNKGGSFIRRKVSPIQPYTEAQRLIRGIITELSRAWGGVLDDDARATWKAFAELHPVTDVFGQTVKLTGEQMYCRLNAVIIFLGGARIDSPPLSLDVSAITDFDAAAAETGPLFNLTGVLPTPLQANELYVVWATKQVGVGKNALGSLYAFLCTRSTLDFTAATIAAAPTGAVRSSNTTTFTTTAPHGLGVGDICVAEGVTDPSFDGKYICQDGTAGSTIVVTNPGPDTTSGTGTISGADSIVTEYVAKYGALEAGKRIGVGIRVQNTVTGASSPLVSKNITVGA
jgi:hypothetical protein